MQIEEKSHKQKVNFKSMQIVFLADQEKKSSSMTDPSESVSRSADEWLAEPDREQFEGFLGWDLCE